MIELLFKLIIGHFVSDYTLQSGDMARGKSRHYQPSFAKSAKLPSTMWVYWLTSHAMTNAGIVWLITDNMLVAFLELVLHWIIDFLKTEGRTNLHADQMLHLICKILYVVLIYFI
ncbi:MAG: hypothetical protein B6244_04790 [Candidatus Cloacimonetes bacterium 4572_55]|nr:MAG: hypothetical protein B6244_04790 [Candidatus Cloacimonetes bacterium 4572_55]